MKISKEEVNQLPLGQFEGEIFLVDDHDEIEDIASFLSKQEVIGFDTETKPTFKKGQRNEVSLLQLSTLKQAFLFRLNHIDFPEPIRNVLERESIIKVGAAVHDDILGLKRLTDSFYPESFFDLNDQLKKVGFHNVGVRNLCAMVLGIRISKSEQVSNWEAENLTEKQKRYAATDAWGCLEIYLKLKEQGYLDELINP